MSHTVSHPLLDDTNADQDQRLEPWIIPDPDADKWPADWNSRSRRNWRVFARPLRTRLTTAQYTLYRRMMRPNKGQPGLLKRADATCGTPADYASELILDALYEEYDPVMPGRRVVGKFHESADTDAHAAAIATAIQDLIESRPSQLPSCVTDRDHVVADALPVTREQLAPVSSAKGRGDL